MYLDCIDMCLYMNSSREGPSCCWKPPLQCPMSICACSWAPAGPDTQDSSMSYDLSSTYLTYAQYHLLRASLVQPSALRKSTKERHLMEIA